LIGDEDSWRKEGGSVSLPLGANICLLIFLRRSISPLSLL